MKEKELKILFKEIGKEPKIINIKNTLEEKQKLVGGLIEAIPYNDVLIICNEEAKILKLRPNLIFNFDYIAGDCFFVGDDYENGDFKSLSDGQIIELMKDIERKSFKDNMKNYTDYDVDFRNL